MWANGEFPDRIDPATYLPELADFFISSMPTIKPREYVSPDGSLIRPAFRVWNQGSEDHRGWRWSDTLDAYGLVVARSGERVVLTNSSKNRTSSGFVNAGNSVTELKVVADRGDESVARAADDTLYVANGQIFVYDSAGKRLRHIDVPERPIQLVLGKGSRTLFILTYHALYRLAI